MDQERRPENLLGVLLDAYWTSLAHDPLPALLLTGLLSLGGVLVVLLAASPSPTRTITDAVTAGSSRPIRPSTDPAGTRSRRSIRVRRCASSNPTPVRVAAIPSP